LTCNILFTGVGGQGVIKASDICALAALYEGYAVKKAESHGLAQRGGLVESHVRFGEHIHSPLIIPGTADFLVCLTEESGQEMAPLLKSTGIHFLRYYRALDSKMRQSRFLNTFFLGVLSTLVDIDCSSWERALKDRMKKMYEKNNDAFYAGRTQAAALVS